MKYYLVTMGVSGEKWEYHHWICPNLKTAIKCSNYKAYVYDFKPINKNSKWEGVGDITKFYDKGWITIEKKQMWEKEWD